MVYTLNRTGSRLIPGNTPFTLWYGFKPSLEHFRVFGCQVYAYIEKKQRTKLDPISHLCHFLGYCDNTKGYRVWDPVTSQVLIRRDVSFNEQVLYGDKQDTSHSSSNSEQEPTAILQITPADGSSHTSDISSHSIHSSDSTLASSSCPFEPTLTLPPVVSDSSSSPLPVNGQNESPLVADSIHFTPRALTSHPNFQSDTPVRMRSLADIDRPLGSPSSTPAQAHLTHAPVSPSITGSSSLASTISSSETSSSVTADFSPDDPTTYLEALHSPDAAQWVHAMTEEVNSLQESKTWELVRLPDGRQLDKPYSANGYSRQSIFPMVTLINSRLVLSRRDTLRRQV